MDLPSFQERIKIMENLMAVFDIYKVESPNMQVELALNLLGHLAKQAGVEEEHLQEALHQYFRLTMLADEAGLSDIQDAADKGSVVVGNLDVSTGKLINFEVLPNKAH